MPRQRGLTARASAESALTRAGGQFGHKQTGAEGTCIGPEFGEDDFDGRTVLAADENLA